MKKIRSDPVTIERVELGYVMLGQVRSDYNRMGWVRVCYVGSR